MFQHMHMTFPIFLVLDVFGMNRFGSNRSCSNTQRHLRDDRDPTVVQYKGYLFQATN